MAKAKNTNTDLDKRLKSVDELVDSSEAIMNKFQDLPTLSKENTLELKKHMTSLKKLKETLGPDAPADVKKRIDQTIEKLRTTSQGKQTISQEEKEKTLESIEGTLKSLHGKVGDLKTQIEGVLGKKKQKNHNKAEKIEKWVDNLTYHIDKIEEAVRIFQVEGTSEQDQALQEIVTYFVDYLDESEYQQQKQTAYIEGLYESFQKDDGGQGSSNSLHEEIEPEIIQETKPPVKEEVQEVPAPKPAANTTTSASTASTVTATTVPQGNAQDQNSFMSRIRQNNFEHEIRRMPVISEKDIKPEYNFFGVFEASAKNLPQETDYYPNAVTKERVNTKNIYPKRKVVGEHTFERFDVDTLFFIFYFQKDTFEQHLAAKELKKRAWRFHKKYLTWFKRLEAPRVTNEDYEQGTYAFFDFEPGGWCQRRKSDFTFKYSYLEDDKP